MHLVMLSGMSLKCTASKWTSVLYGNKYISCGSAVCFFKQQFNKYIICFHRSTALYPMGEKAPLFSGTSKFCIVQESQIFMLT